MGGPRRSNAVRQGLIGLALSLVTLALFGTEVRFVAVAPLPVANLDLARGLTGWSGLGAEILPSDNGSRELRLARLPDAPAPLVTRIVPEPGRFTHVRIAAEVRTSGIETGRERWQRAGLIVPSFGAQGVRLGHWPYEIALIGTDTAWTRYSRVLPVGHDVASMRLFAYVGGPAGVLAIRALAIDGMAEAGWALPVRLALFLAWGGLGLWVLSSLLARWRPFARPLSAALGVAILFFALYPQPYFHRLVRPVNATLFGIIAFLPSRDDVAAAISAALGDGGVAESGRRNGVPSPDPSQAGPRRPQEPSAAPANTAANGGAPPPGPASARPAKPGQGWARGPHLFPEWLGSEDRGHIAAFAVLAFFARLGFPLARWSALAAALLVLGASTEALQTFSPTRDAELSDLASDLMGILAGLALAGLVRRGLRKTSTKSAA